MERNVFLINDATLANACVAFAQQLGFTVTPDIHLLSEGNYLTTGSKKYDINWIRNESFVNKKGDTVLDLNEDYSVFITNITETYLDGLEEDEVTLVDEVPTPDAATVKALFAKVKGQKKSPAKYYVTYKNDQWVATTNAEGSYGNLADLNANI